MRIARVLGVALLAFAAAQPALARVYEVNGCERVVQRCGLGNTRAAVLHDRQGRRHGGGG